MSLLGDTKILLLDEPTQGMDIATKRFVWELLSRQKKNRVMIIATQDMQEASALGDRLALISHGSLKLCGSR